MVMRLGIATTLAVAGLAAGCTGHGARPARVAPGTPAWLRIRISNFVNWLGDPTPDTIVVRLGVRDHGRVVDRVYARGDFVCKLCTRPPGGGAPRGHVAGFTVDARTHRELSFSVNP